MNTFIPLYVMLQTFVQDRVEQLKERSDRGVTAIEYGALIMLAAVIVGILYKVVKETMEPQVRDALNRLFPGGGGGDGN